MRTFEILLFCANLAAMFLSLRPQSKPVWLLITGINLFTLSLHGMTEGLRSQMVFSYLFVALLAIFVLIKAARSFLVPRVVKVITLCLFMVSFALTAILASIFPLFTLPIPTGKYAVGVRYLHLTDEKRADPFRDKALQQRELMVKLYYPAKRDDSRPLVPYFHGSNRLLAAFASFYGMPSFLFDHLSLVKTHSRENLEPSDTPSPFPLILLSHGAGTTVEVGTSQSEDLASQGYIVAAIDHTYVSSATAFPDRIVTAHEATTNFDTPEPAEPITQIMADDARFVLDALGEVNQGRLTPGFQGKLNLDAVGAIGHSVGGAVAYNLAMNDRRVKAAINLDGVVYVAPKESGTIAPFLMLASDQVLLPAIEKRESLMPKLDSTSDARDPAYEAAYNRAQRNMRALAAILKASGNLYTIDGSAHMKFTDMGLFIGSPWLRELLQIGGKTDPARCLTITQALTVAFFDQHLKAQSADAIAPLVRTYPELRNVPLK